MYELYAYAAPLASAKRSDAHAIVRGKKRNLRDLGKWATGLPEGLCDGQRGGEAHRAHGFAKADEAGDRAPQTVAIAAIGHMAQQQVKA